jgi:HJR/Mrr/RecB family endonuclease
VWKFSGDIRYICSNCGHDGTVSVDDFTIDCVGGDERQMGMEYIYKLEYDFDCDCGHNIMLEFEVSEYPANAQNFVIDNSSGAEIIGEPYIEYLSEIYHLKESLHLTKSIPEIITILKDDATLLYNITPDQFEKLIAEIFSAKGFKVEQTKKTRDGGKDIIAFRTDELGIVNKYFIECKHYAKENKVSVDIVRALHGTKNTKDGPNKTILATTSSFSADARKFVENDIQSKWDMELVDHNQIVAWIYDYEESSEL